MKRTWAAKAVPLLFAMMGVPLLALESTPADVVRVIDYQGRVIDAAGQGSRIIIRTANYHEALTFTKRIRNITAPTARSLSESEQHRDPCHKRQGQPVSKESRE